LGDVLSETRTLTSIVGVLFGFLLATTFYAQNLTALEHILLICALFFSMLSLGIFSLPIIYHHIAFPYFEIKKYMLRVHRFTVIGFIPFILTFLFSTYLALERLSQGYGYIGVIVIIFSILIVYKLRK